MKWYFDLDLDRCIGCGACSVACMDQNDLAPELGEAPFRKVFTVESGTPPFPAFHYISSSCQHCDDAPCVNACPLHCLWKDPETGFTLFDTEKCIGCHSCALACPYNSVSFTRENKMFKCDGCIARLQNGLDPACVRVCPFSALKIYTEDAFNAAGLSAAPGHFNRYTAKFL